jgi:hypothetical protein
MGATPYMVAPRPNRTVNATQLYADDVRVDMLLDVAGTPGAAGPGAQGGALRLGLDVVEQMVITEQPGELPMRLEATIPNAVTEFGALHTLFPLNGHIRLSCTLGTLPPFTIQDFWIRTHELIDDGRERFQITAYDPLWALNKDECVYFMAQPQNPALSIIRRVLEDRSVPMAAPFNGPGTMIRGWRFASPTRLALIQQCLMWAYQHADSNGPDKDPWFPAWRDGKFTLLQPGNNTSVWWVRQDDSVSYFSHRTTMEDFVSEVLILGPDFLQLATGNPWDFADPFTALVPNEHVDYNALLNQDPNAPSSGTPISGHTQKYQQHDAGGCWLDTFDSGGNLISSQQVQDGLCTSGSSLTIPGDEIQLVAQEAVDLFQLAAFKEAQSYAHVRKVIQADIGDPVQFVQQALDILNIQGIPWDVRQMQTVLLPWLHRGDALLVTAGTMDTKIGFVTGVEHDFTPPGRSHITMDSSGILGRRVRRQHYIGPLPGSDGNDLLPSELPGASPNQDPTQTAEILIPDPAQWDPANPKPYSLGTASNAQTVDPRGVTRTVQGWDPEAPQYHQTFDWVCSCAATAWMLRSVGFKDVTDIQIKDMLGSGNVNSSSGLLDATGGALVSLLRNPPFNLNAYNRGRSSWSFDELLASAGTKPMIVGGVGWYHWSGIRGRDGDNLRLANPAPGYKGPVQTMSRAQSAGLGPFYVVWIDPPS